MENLLLGDMRKRGETHQRMYDRLNLPALQQSCDFTEAGLLSFDQSVIDDWRLLGLDMDESGYEYKPVSLYLKATKY
jgi:hypothetical protein